MLGLLGLFGAMIAGVVADSLVNHDHASGDEAESGHPDHEDDTDTAAQGSVADLLHDHPEDAADAHDTSPEPGLHAALPHAHSADAPIRQHGTAGADRLDGGTANDRLSGRDGNDALQGRGGNDSLAGDGGNDTVDAGDGRDTLTGGAGSDHLLGGSGNDRLDGGDGNDQLDGQDGNDTITGGAGDDFVTGGQGNDSITADDGADTVDGGDGNDQIQGGKGSDDLSGGNGNDTIWGEGPSGGDTEADFLNGGAGDDLLHIGAGDYANGGDGHDTFMLDDHPADQEAAQITDWHPNEDSLIVVYDPAAHPTPTLGVVTDKDSPDATVTLDGIPIAHVTGGAGMTMADITLKAAA